jgi:hypothetical protein
MLICRKIEYSLLFLSTKSMKTFIIPILISGCLLILVTDSCKKPDTVKPAPQPVTPTNPIIATATCDYVFDETSLTSNGWTKVFDDNFSGDLSNWYPYTGGVAEELECNQLMPK